VLLCRAPQGCDELAGIRTLPSRGGEEHVQRLGSLTACGGAQLAHRLRSGRDARLGDAAGALDFLAQREPHAFVVEGNDGVPLDLGDEEANRVRADVDDPDTHAHES